VRNTYAVQPFRNCRTATRCFVVCAAAALVLAAPAGGRAAGVVSTIDFGTGSRAVARAGVAGETVAELLDSPPLLAEPAAQHFVDVAFAQLETLAQDETLKRRYAALRGRLRPGDGKFDRTLALRTFQTLTVDLLHALGGAREGLFVLGTAAQHVDYNSRVLREAQTDRELRGLIGSVADGDGVFPEVGPLRAKLAAAAPEDWKDSEALAHAIVVAILGSADAAPFPSSPGIWTILVRTRPAGSGAEKRDAPHDSLDVVWFDGRHRTFAGYPAGGTDFARDADRLECLRDREPQSGTLQAVPVAPPAGVSYDAVAASFERSCDAIDVRPPPYLVSEASDAKLIAAMLSAAHIDPNSAK
jgi:hypothetical protein